MTILPGSIVCFLDERDSLDSMIVGGYYLPKRHLIDLDNHMLMVKKEFGLDEVDTIKWNLRDDSCRNAQRLIEENRVTDLRKRVFSITEYLPIIVLMSQVWKGKPENLLDAWEWAFVDILQRLCIDLERKQSELENMDYYPFLDVVFDWFPGREKLETYFDVYQSAYLNGFRFEGNELRPLRTFKACPCLIVTSAKYSQALQLTDFFLGSTADFFTWCYEGERKQSAELFFSSFYQSFRRGDNNEIFGCGLITKRDSRDKIQLKLKELGLEP